MVPANGVRQPPTAEYGSVNRDAVRHTAEVKNRSDRAVGCTLCSAAAGRFASRYGLSIAAFGLFVSCPIISVYVVYR